MMRIARIVAALLISIGMALAVAGTANAGGGMTHNTVLDFPGMTHN
jgi:multisubunit Na+/H+ antiporter MnhB subunit